MKMLGQVANSIELGFKRKQAFMGAIRVALAVVNDRFKVAGSISEVITFSVKDSFL